MKSMLLEASTVIKAIEKAWVDSGRPAEFTINVLEKGETSFLGFSKKPAIISIAFDPRKVTQRPSVKSDQRQPVQPLSKAKPQEFGQPASKHSETTNKPGDRRSFTRKPDPMVKPLRRQQPNVEFWAREWIDDIETMVKDTIFIMGALVPFSIKVEKKILSVMFDKGVLKTADDERQLFASLSYLFMQMLKKKHKKKLQSYHIVLSSKEHDTAKKTNTSFNR